jgi:nitric oxide dioxygenase
MGLASGWLHDNVKEGTILKVAPPAGEFYLPAHPERPVVLLSGGVGLTPMVSMLEALAADGAGVPVHYVHGTHDRETHAMRDHVRQLAALRSGINVSTFHQTPLAGEVAGEDYDHSGIITEEWLLANTPVSEADYYICGPRPFLRAAVSSLSLSGVASDRIHYEFFGPADELLAA